MFPPERIICLTEETVETLYLLGEDFRIVGISGYAVRPPRARREKPRVCAFTSADIPKILNLKPDLVLTFSDLQADIAATLIRAHVDVHAFNQRTVARVYFEERDEPMISGIGWVSELIDAAGGIDVFAGCASSNSAKDRIVTAEDVIRNEPDIIIGSWCGKKFRPEKLAKRPAFDRVPLHEIKSPLILQPGPAALTDGLAALQAIIANAIS
jgi:iron complex transport system substrate-binding protein